MYQFSVHTYHKVILPISLVSILQGVKNIPLISGNRPEAENAEFRRNLVRNGSESSGGCKTKARDKFRKKSGFIVMKSRQWKVANGQRNRSSEQTERW